jgi:uncharacterized protein (TIGR03437 family)
MKALYALTLFLPIMATNAQTNNPVEPAYFTVYDINDGNDLTFVVQITDPVTVQQARALLTLPESDRLHVQGTVVKAPASFNAPWGFHVDPVSVGFFETAVEVCDANAQYVQDHLTEVGEAFLPGNHWCPWNSKLLAEIPAPADPATYLRVASAASDNEASISPGALISIYGTNLTDRTEQAETSEWAPALAGVTVEINAAASSYSSALPLLMASPTQVNALIPADVPVGPVSIALKNANGITLQTASWVEPVAPALFVVSQNNIDYAAASLLRIHADGSSSTESLIAVDPVTGQMVPVPVDPGSPSDQLYLSLYGSGFTNVNAQAVGLASVTHSAEHLPILYAGPQGQIAGLDQINIGISGLMNDQPYLDLLLLANIAAEYPVKSNRVRILIGGAGSPKSNQARVR